MKKILLTLLLAGMTECALGGYVVVTDTIYVANHLKAAGGTIFITPNSQFACSDGSQIYPIVIPVNISTLGIFSVTLCSNTTALTANTSYRVSIQPRYGPVTTETWVVPVTNPSHLPDVRTSPTPIPSFLVSLSQLTTSLNGALRANGTGVATVSGTAGNCVLVDGTSAPCAITSIYSAAVSAQTSVSITAATHGKGTTPLATCLDNSTPKVVVLCSYTRNTSGDLVFSFNPAFTGTVEVRP